MSLPARVAELRPQLQDHAILDWIELLALLPDGTGSLSTDELRSRWSCRASRSRLHAIREVSLRVNGWAVLRAG